MKKFFNIVLTALCIGGLVLTSGCKGDEGGEENTAAAHRGRVAGIYPVKATTPLMAGNHYANMVLAKYSSNDLCISGAVKIPDLGTVNVNLVLSSLKEYADEEGQAVTGYFFNIDEQEVDVAGTAMTFSGTGKYDGYDGKVYKNADVAFISFEISGAGNIVVEVESGSYTDYRSELAGSYPVMIYSQMVIDYLGNSLGDFEVTVEGDGFRVKGSTQPQITGVGVPYNIEFVLSGAVPFDEGSIRGYYFKVAEQLIDLPQTINFVTFSGTGQYDGYDGKIYKSADGLFISFEVSGQNIKGTSVGLLVETAAE